MRVRQRKSGKHKSNKKERGRAPPTMSSSRRMTVSVCGEVEA